MKKPNLSFEKLFWQAGCNCIAGVDEVGVAPLAGPVVAAAVILKPGTTLRDIPKVRDSKLLTPNDRKILHDTIISKCLDFAIGQASVEEIDVLNIHNASHLAMKRALEQLKKIEAAVIDGPFVVPSIKILQFAVIDGDAKVASISAASIIAKVTRDLMMSNLNEQYPEYGFDRHKGYPTKFHISRIIEHGPSLVHRKSFLKNIRRGA